MFIVGLTGGIGCGKSTVAAVFQAARVPVIDSDLIARQVVAPGTAGWKEIKSYFGDEVLDEVTGELKRAVLAERVFKDDEARKRLNAITHPKISNAMTFLVAKYLLQGYSFVVIDMPLLFETGFQKLCHKVITVSCSETTQINRVMERDSCTREQVVNRIKAQMSLAEKREKADIVIDTECHIEKVKERANCALRDIREDRFHWKLRGVVLMLTVVITVLIRYTLFT